MGSLEQHRAHADLPADPRGRAADRTEAAIVRRARNGGMAWAEIATQLGVSRQAVHKKYGRR